MDGPGGWRVAYWKKRCVVRPSFIGSSCTIVCVAASTATRPDVFVHPSPDAMLRVQSFAANERASTGRAGCAHARARARAGCSSSRRARVRASVRGRTPARPGKLRCDRREQREAPQTAMAKQVGALSKLGSTLVGAGGSGADFKLKLISPKKKRRNLAHPTGARHANVLYVQQGTKCCSNQQNK